MHRILVTGISGDLGRAFVYYIRKTNKDFFIVGTDIDDTFIHVPFVDKKYIVPPARNEDDYIARVNQIIKADGIEVIIPQTDYEIRTLSKNRDKIKAQVRLPPYDTIVITQDKYKSNKIWEQKGLPVPKATLVENKGDLRDNVWLRPRALICGGGMQATHALTKLDAEMWINKHSGWGSFMQSEYLPGKIYGFDSLWGNGELIGYSLKERLKYLSSSDNLVGSGTAIIRTLQDEVIFKICVGAILVVDKNPDGCFSVDLRENAKGEPCITEINSGRFLTTSLWLFAEGDCNLPLNYVNMSLGEEIEDFRPLEPDLYLFSVKGQDPRLIRKEELKWCEGTIANRLV